MKCYFCNQEFDIKDLNMCDCKRNGICDDCQDRIYVTSDYERIEYECIECLNDALDEFL